MLRKIVGYAVIWTREGLTVVPVRDREKAATVATFYRGELVEEFPNRWDAEKARRGMTWIPEAQT